MTAVWALAGRDRRIETVCSLLKKGTGTSRNAAIGGVKAAWLGASPFFNRLSDEIGLIAG